MNNIIVSNENSLVVSSLNKLGFNPIFSEDISVLLPFERKHTDIQCLKINNTFFVLNSCKRLISELKKLGKEVIETEKSIKKDYPDNVLLNALFINNKLYCKASALDNSVKKYCEKNAIEIINVNQGYTKCSTALIDDCFITADKGIFKALTENGVEGLFINSGNILLPGTDYGFIGGCCFCYNDTVFFTGDINSHTDSKIIKEFIYKKGLKIESLTDEDLYDIGGFVVV
ncbi:MAG: hypothetical protein IJ903_01595 [Ruminococcus sp.]|nr:hypothetical protein [Ruminococcus sp.]